MLPTHQRLGAEPPWCGGEKVGRGGVPSPCLVFPPLLIATLVRGDIYAASTDLGQKMNIVLEATFQNQSFVCVWIILDYENTFKAYQWSIYLFEKEMIWCVTCFLWCVTPTNQRDIDISSIKWKSASVFVVWLGNSLSMSAGVSAKVLAKFWRLLEFLKNICFFLPSHKGQISW